MERVADVGEELAALRALIVPPVTWDVQEGACMSIKELLLRGSPSGIGFRPSRVREQRSTGLASFPVMLSWRVGCCAAYWVRRSASAP